MEDWFGGCWFTSGQSAGELESDEVRHVQMEFVSCFSLELEP